MKSLLLALASFALLAAAACGGDGDPVVSPASAPFRGSLSIPAGAEIACTRAGPQDLAPLLVALAVDSIEIRIGHARGDAVTPQTVAQAGVPCGTAKDLATCRATLAAIHPGGLEDGGIATRSVVRTTGPEVITTKGDAITRLADLPSLVAAFGGAVDTVAEAALVLDFTGIGLGCGDVRLGAVWRVENAFEAVGSESTCNDTYREHLRVTRDGTVETLARELTRREDVDC